MNYHERNEKNNFIIGNIYHLIILYACCLTFLYYLFANAIWFLKKMGDYYQTGLTTVTLDQQVSYYFLYPIFWCYSIFILIMLLWIWSVRLKFLKPYVLFISVLFMFFTGNYFFLMKLFTILDKNRLFYCTEIIAPLVPFLYRWNFD